MAMKDKTTIFEASIEELAQALQSGTTTCVDLVAAHLHRISRLDCRGPGLNSIPLLNLDVFRDAAASDDRRTSHTSLGTLDGIPYTVKDSYKVRDMTVASGSPAFQNLRSNEDAFTVSKLREAGAVLIGKTNMCPMAYGGMQRGVYGRAESPYNKDHLAAAFASGSSNGSGASTGASLAAFGMGEETVSSGRSPASNNGLVAYTPSRGFISIRGNWPLYPTCDVVVPHTRSMADLFEVLEVITVKDNNTQGDFWRDQPFLNIPDCWNDKPSSISSFIQDATLKGLKIAVPEMYIGGKQLHGGLPVHTSPEVQKLWQQARKELEAAGATVVTVSDFPVVRVYEDPTSKLNQLPKDWNKTERGTLIAHAWEDFLRANDDPEIRSIKVVEPTQIFPPVPPDHPQIKYSEPANAIRWSNLAGYVKTDNDTNENTVKGHSAMYSIANLEHAVKALESMRKTLFEDWLVENHFDFVAFPAAGDVGSADADINDESARFAWTNGVKYSNGNRAFRHLGIPSVTVPMGLIEGKGMPMGLTFLGKAYDDANIMKCAHAYEKISKKRTAPGLTPMLASDRLDNPDQAAIDLASSRPEVKIVEYSGILNSAATIAEITIKGEVVIQVSSITGTKPQPILDIHIDGELVSPDSIHIEEQTASSQSGAKSSSSFTFTCISSTTPPPIQDERNKVAAKIARDSTMIVVLARGTAENVNGEKTKKTTKPSGWIGLIHQSDLQNT